MSLWTRFLNSLAYSEVTHSQTLRFQNHDHADLSEIVYHYFQPSAFITLPYIRSIGHFIDFIAMETITITTKIQAHTTISTATTTAIISAVSTEINS